MQSTHPVPPEQTLAERIAADAILPPAIDTHATQPPPTLPTPPAAGLPPTPPYPLHALPPNLADDIRERRRALNYPVDFSALAVLVVAAAAIGPAVSSKFKQGLTAPSILYGSVVGPSGVGKSHPLNAYTRPLTAINRELREAFRAALKAYNEVKADAKANKLPEPERPDGLGHKPAVALTTDATLEAIADVLQRSGRHGLLNHSDELRTWLTGFTRYKSGGGDDAYWLTLYDGGDLNVSRKTGPDIYVDAPRISVLGGIQPALLYSITDGGRAASGILGRILFAWPDELLAAPLPEDDSNPNGPVRWERCVRRLHELGERPDAGWQMPWTAEARGVYRAWDIVMCERLNRANDAEAATESEQLAKLKALPYRLALILRLLWWAYDAKDGDTPPHDIDADSVRRSIDVAEYHLAVAAKVRAALPPEQHAARHGMDERHAAYLDALPGDFTTVQAHDIAEACSVPVDTANKWLRKWCAPNGPLARVSTGVYRKLAPGE